MFQKEIPWTLLGITVVILCAPSAMAAPMTFMRADCPANQLCEFKNDTDPDASKRWDTLWKAMLLPAVQFTGITFVKDPNEPTDLGELFFTKTITFTNLQPVTITFDGPAVGEMFFNISEIATNNTDQDWWDFHFEILDRVEGALQPPFNTLHPSKAHLHPNQFAAANINKLKGLDVPGKNGNNGVPKMSAFANDANDVVPKKGNAGNVWQVSAKKGNAGPLRLHDKVDAKKQNMKFDFTERPSVPEPSSLILLSSGIVALWVVRRRLVKRVSRNLSLRASATRRTASP